MSSLSSALSSLLSSSNTADSIDLSSILQAATGASSSGIDVTAAVNAAIQAAEGPETTWQTEQTTLSSQASALTQIQTSAGTLGDDLNSLNSLTGPLTSATVSSSNSSVLTGSAASGTASGSDTVVVTSLATTASYASSAVTDTTTDLPAGSITITPSSGTATTITIGSGVDTLTDLENAINTSGAGVTASIVTDASGSRLAIVSNTSGAGGNFSVTSSDGDFGFTQGATGANAALTVNGISISSASNTVTGVIPGVTLNLLNASPGTSVTLAVTPNTTAAESSISQFVSDYNTLIGLVNAQYSDTGSGEGVLAQDATVETLQSDLLGSLGYTTTNGTGSTATTTSLASLGITVNTDGSLTIDSGTLTSALQNNFSQVQNFFQGPSLSAFAGTLYTQLNSFTDPGDGAFTVDLQNMSTEYNDLSTDITNFQANIIAPLKIQLTAEFSSAEIALQQLPGELKDVDAELGLNNNSNS